MTVSLEAPPFYKLYRCAAQMGMISWCVTYGIDFDCFGLKYVGPV